MPWNGLSVSLQPLGVALTTKFISSKLNEQSSGSNDPTNLDLNSKGWVPYPWSNFLCHSSLIKLSWWKWFKLARCTACWQATKGMAYQLLLLTGNSLGPRNFLVCLSSCRQMCNSGLSLLMFQDSNTARVCPSVPPACELPRFFWGIWAFILQWRKQIYMYGIMSDLCEENKAEATETPELAQPSNVT